jgi:hypothetical protein
MFLGTQADQQSTSSIISIYEFVQTDQKEREFTA